MAGPSGIQWRDVGVNFGGSNQAMSNALAGVSQAGTVFEKIAKQESDKRQRAEDNEFRQKQFDENVRQYGLDNALKERGQTETERHNRAMEDIGRDRAANGGSKELTRQETADMFNKMFQNDFGGNEEEDKLLDDFANKQKAIIAGESPNPIEGREAQDNLNEIDRIKQNRANLFSRVANDPEGRYWIEAGKRGLPGTVQGYAKYMADMRKQDREDVKEADKALREFQLKERERELSRQKELSEDSKDANLIYDSLDLDEERNTQLRTLRHNYETLFPYLKPSIIAREIYNTVRPTLTNNTFFGDGKRVSMWSTNFAKELTPEKILEGNDTLTIGIANAAKDQKNFLDGISLEDAEKMRNMGANAMIARAKAAETNSMEEIAKSNQRMAPDSITQGNGDNTIARETFDAQWNEQQGINKAANEKKSQDDYTEKTVRKQLKDTSLDLQRAERSLKTYKDNKNPTAAQQRNIDETQAKVDELRLKKQTLDRQIKMFYSGK